MSVILDLVTNHLDGDTFHFIFFRKARIWEPAEENPLKADFQNEAADAAVCIGAYLEDEKTFSYKKEALYLKLSVERRLDDYALDYPFLPKCSDESRQPELRAMLERRVVILPGKPCRRTRRELLDAADGARIRMVCAEDVAPPENAIERSGREMMRDFAT